MHRTCPPPGPRAPRVPAHWPRLLALLLLLLAPRAGAAQTKTEHTPDTDAPAVLVFPGSGTIQAGGAQGAQIDSIVFCDATGFDQASLQVTWNGTPVTGSFPLYPQSGEIFAPSYQAVDFPGCAPTMIKRQYTDLYTLVFREGENVLTIHLCDRAYCTDETVRYVYNADALPVVRFNGSTVTADQASATVTATFTDDRGVQAGTARMTINGAPASPCTWTAANAAFGSLSCTVPLAVGPNVLAAEIRDSGGQLGTASSTLVRDHAAPQIAFSPDSLRTADSVVSVQVSFTDDGVIDGDTRRITLNGEPTHGGSIKLRPGFNTLEASVCDQAGRCATRRARHLFRHTADRARPVFSPVQPQVEDRLIPGAFEPVATHTTPSWVSLDQERSITLVHVAHQARPWVLIQADVEDHSATPPDAMSIRVTNADFTANQTFTHGGFYHFYQGGNGTSRLAARLDVSHLATGAYEFGIAIDSWWRTPAGGWEGSASGAYRKVRVLVVNERDSPIGPGWTLAGLQRLHVQGDTVLVLTEGDGSALYWRKGGTSAAGEVTYAAPAGETSSLVWIPSASRFERRYRDGTVARFDPLRRLRSVRGRLGDSTTWVYDAAGKLTSIVDPAGQATRFEYHWDWALARIIDPAGRTTTLWYQGTGRYALTSTDIHDPDGPLALRAQYDTLGQLTGWQDRAGGQWRVARDHGGETRTLTLPQVFAGGRWQTPEVQIRSYASVVYPAAPTGGDNRGPRVRPDEAWVAVRYPGADSATYVPDRWGLPLRVRDGHGRDGWTFRDHQGRDSLIVTPQGDTTRYAYENGQLSLVSGRAGTTRLQWGGFGQLAQVAGAGGGTQYFRSSAGLLDSMRVNGVRYSWTYDARGRVQTARDAAGRLLRFHYQPGGMQNLDTIYTPTGAVAYRYDAAGRMDRVTNPLGQSTTVAYDALNRAAWAADPLQALTTLSYGPVRLDTVRDARQQVHGFWSNVLGWDTARVDPRGGRTYVRYGEDGRANEVINRRGQRVGLEYDGRGRLLRQIADRPGTALRDTVSFAYDTVPAGRVVNLRDSGTYGGADTAVAMVVVRNAASTDTLYYSQDGRLMQQVTGRPGGHRYTLTTTYADSVGLPRWLDWEQGGTRLQAWEYDEIPGLPDPGGGMMQLPRVRSVEATAVTYHGAGDGRVHELVHPFGGEQRLYAPNTGFLRGIRFGGAAADAAAGVLYRYDALGRVTERIRAAQDTAFLYRYDAAGRVVKYGRASIVPGSCGTDAYGQACVLNADSTWTAGYTYDAVGNPTWFSDAQTETGNRLARFGGWAMTYDADGNMTRKTNGVTDYRLHWNALGQLDSVAIFDGAGAYLGADRFAYDGLGRRVRKTSPHRDLSFVYDGQQVVMETSPATGAVLARYAYYPGIDQPHSMVRDGRTYHYLRDHQGSVTALVDSAGTPVNRYRYTPYGIQEVKQEGVQNRITFTGREWDWESGLYYYRARWYDPMSGRFVSEDPLGLGGGINPYAYVGGDPVNRVDPSGLVPCVYLNGVEEVPQFIMELVDEGQAQFCFSLAPVNAFGRRPLHFTGYTAEDPLYTVMNVPWGLGPVVTSRRPMSRALRYRYMMSDRCRGQHYWNTRDAECKRYFSYDVMDEARVRECLLATDLGEARKDAVITNGISGAITGGAAVAAGASVVATAGWSAFGFGVAMSVNEVYYREKAWGHCAANTPRVFRPLY